MKGLILKDLYSIAASLRTTLIVWAVMSVMFLLEDNTAIYLCMITMMLSMLIGTTYAYDDLARWNPYAAILPVKRSTIVGAKFVVLGVLIAVGIAVGLVVSVVGTLLFRRALPGVELYAVLPVALSLAMLQGSVTILFMTKFGAERARLLLILSYLVPGAALGGGIALFALLAQPSDTVMLTAMACLPIPAAAVAFALYRWSAALLERKEM